MDRTDIAELLIDGAELATDTEWDVKTRGSGDYSNPVVLVRTPDVYRRAEGNTSNAGLYDEDDDGSPDGVLLKHIYAGSTTLEIRSQSEIDSLQVAQDVYDHLSTYEEYPTSFHADMNDMSLGSIEQGGFQAPLPEPVYKQTFSVEFDYTKFEKLPFNEHGGSTGEPIENIYDDINNS